MPPTANDELETVRFESLKTLRSQRVLNKFKNQNLQVVWQF